MFVDYEPLPTPGLSREVVAEETDLDILEGWSDELRVIESELHTAISSVSLANPQQTLGMARKLAYIRIARNWVNERILEVGGEIPGGAMGAKFKRVRYNLTCANQKLEKQNRQIKELRRRIAELEQRECA